MRSPAEFSQYVFELLKEHFPERDLELDPVNHTIHAGEARFGMSNLYIEFQQGRLSETEAKQALIDNFRQAFAMLDSAETMLPEKWEDVEPRLRVQLANASLRELDQSLNFPFSSEVRSAIVVDSPAGYAYIRPLDAERWGKSAIDLQEIARDNLLKASANMQVAFIPGPPSFAILQTCDGYDAARILLPEVRRVLIEKITGSDRGTILVGIPNRDFLIAWPENMPVDLDKSIRAQVIADAKNQHHPLSSQPMRVTLDTITPAS